MKLHTFDDVVEDIKRFEQVTCQFADAIQRARFLKLYSEFYDKPVNGEMTVDSFNKRVHEFIHADNVMLPSCDIFPDTKSKFWAYKAKLSETGTLLVDEDMSLLGTSDSEEEVRDIASSKIDTTCLICVVNSEISEVNFFKRSLH
jgi:hypothetical protein